jgi:hypothetical protein
MDKNSLVYLEQHFWIFFVEDNQRFFHNLIEKIHCQHNYVVIKLPDKVINPYLNIQIPEYDFPRKTFYIQI